MSASTPIVAAVRPAARQHRCGLCNSLGHRVDQCKDGRIHASYEELINSSSSRDISGLKGYVYYRFLMANFSIPQNMVDKYIDPEYRSSIMDDIWVKNRHMENCVNELDLDLDHETLTRRSCEIYYENPYWAYLHSATKEEKKDARKRVIEQIHRSVLHLIERDEQRAAARVRAKEAAKREQQEIEVRISAKVREYSAKLDEQLALMHEIEIRNSFSQLKIKLLVKYATTVRDTIIKEHQFKKQALIVSGFDIPEDGCSICYEQMTKKNCVKHDCCKQHFCSGCVMKITNNRCPTCRNPCPGNVIHQEFELSI